MNKTIFTTTELTFLGFLVNGKGGLVMVPLEKVEKAILLIDEFLKKGKRKTTIRRLQQLCGFLNFLGRAVVPGHAFTCRLYGHLSHKLKPHHHIRVSAEKKLDLLMWKQFLAHPSVFSSPFADFSKCLNPTAVDLYTDAAKGESRGCGGVCGTQWFFVGWDKEFLRTANPSIEYLELYAVAIGVILWIHKFKNSRIQLFCDNQSVVHMINNNTSLCKNCMILIRIIVLHGLIHNTKIGARFVRSKLNVRADAISRKNFQLFHKLTNYMADPESQPIHSQFWPMSKVWSF